MRMIDFCAKRFMTMSCDIAGKCSLHFITRASRVKLGSVTVMDT
ncbi:hypothetical protein Pla52n_06490 [Stieleria varia]|uniref:Uncharacterized protein n=1 Tax=Stieleria varia TaxID=2528005 RepID=A0A5C6B7Y2_9BACT|nr:hypothetical protein Pla52n_06490 [Stieleria varia]